MKDNKGSLRNIRVLKKNMIFLQSYDEHIATSTLKQLSTFSPSGEVENVKAKQNFKNSTTYVTYIQQQSAAIALIAFTHLSSRLRVLFGTVQYCKYFMRKAECRNDGCVFLHVRDKKNQIIVNDQIQEAVYDDHYDMALEILEKDSYRQMKNILQNDSIDDNSLIKKGLKKAAQALNIDLKTVQKTVRAKGSELSTQESDLGRDEVFEKNIGEHSKSEQNSTSLAKEYSQDYLSIRIIKQLIRHNDSKIHNAGDGHQQQIQQRSKMMLYQIIKY